MVEPKASPDKVEKVVNSVAAIEFARKSIDLSKQKEEVKPVEESKISRFSFVSKDLPATTVLD